MLPEADLLEILSRVAKTNQRIRLADVFEDGPQTDPTQPPPPGLLPTVREFLKANPEWTVIQYDRSTGAMALSRAAEDKAKPPSLFRAALGFTQAAAAHAANGMALVTPEEHARRVELCIVCPHRVFDKCGLCRCRVDLKASWASESCPDNPPRW